MQLGKMIWALGATVALGCGDESEVDTDGSGGEMFAYECANRTTDVLNLPCGGDLGATLGATSVRVRDICFVPNGPDSPVLERMEFDGGISPSTVSEATFSLTATITVRLTRMTTRGGPCASENAFVRSNGGYAPPDECTPEIASPGEVCNCVGRHIVDIRDAPLTALNGEFTVQDEGVAYPTGNVGCFSEPLGEGFLSMNLISNRFSSNGLTSHILFSIKSGE